MQSTAAVYQVILRDTSYTVVAVFDDPISCEYTNEVNAVGSFSLQIAYDDPRVDLFVLDGMVEIYRSVPGIGLTWYKEFTGLFRDPKFNVTQDGKKVFTASGVGLNDFLFRTIINYPEGTIKSYKNIAAETAMKEYANENCGPIALVTPPYERVYDGVLPDFIVDTDTALGPVWEGDRAFENLLDVLVDIATTSLIDFNVVWDDFLKKFVFYTYVGQQGLDRTSVGVDATTGLNASGNVPVVFSLLRGNVKSISYEYNRTSEANVISVLGDGDGATRTIVSLDRPATVASSPWNRREASRSQGGFISQMEFAGEAALNEMQAREIIEFEPMLQPMLMYGRDYMLGDRVSVIFRNVTRHKRIVSVSNSMSSGEAISLTFADL